MPDNLNLVPDRGPNVWDRPQRPAAERARTGGAVGGAVMLAAGAAAAFFGGRMLYRAMKGGAAAGMETAATRERDDLVDEESEASFPASDAPSWTAADGATLDRRR